MLTRRRFIGTTLGAGTALATGVQAALPQQKREIVDAQVHLWKANTPDWPWVPGAKPQLPEPFTDRAGAAADGRGRRRPRGHRAADGSTTATTMRSKPHKRYPEPLRRHGPHSAAESEIGRAAAEVERAAGHARRARDVQHAGDARPGSRTAPPTGSGRRPRRPACRSCSWRSAWSTCSIRSRSAIRSCRSSSTTWASIPAIAKKGQMAEVIGHAVALAKYPNVSVKLSNLPEFVAGALSLQGPDPAPEARVRRLRAAALPLGNRRDQRAAPRELDASASPISPRRSTSCRRATRTGCWAARSCRSSNGPKFAHFGVGIRTLAEKKFDIAAYGRIRVLMDRRGRAVPSIGAGMADDVKHDKAAAEARKSQQAADGKKAMLDYEAEAAALRARTEKLRALRLAREAAAPPPPPKKPRPRRPRPRRAARRRRKSPGRCRTGWTNSARTGGATEHSRLGRRCGDNRR